MKSIVESDEPIGRVKPMQEESLWSFFFVFFFCFFLLFSFLNTLLCKRTIFNRHRIIYFEFIDITFGSIMCEDWHSLVEFWIEARTTIWFSSFDYLDHPIYPLFNHHAQSSRFAFVFSIFHNSVSVAVWYSFVLLFVCICQLSGIFFFSHII